MKIRLSLLSALAAASLFIGCSQPASPTNAKITDPAPDAVVDGDDANDPGNGGATGLFVLGYEHDTDFKLFVWSGTFTTANDADGGLKCVAGTSNWAGGSFANVSGDTTPSFNFSSVAKIKFKIKANIPPSQIHYILGFSAGEYNKTLSDLGYAALSDARWTPIEIDLSAAKSGKTVTSAFSFVMSDDAGDGIKQGEWISVRDIDWVDSNGASVDITQ